MKRRILALLLVMLLAMTVTSSMAVFARPGEEDDKSIIVDDFDRDDYKDNRIYTTDTGVIYWQEANENVVKDSNNSLPIEDGALVLEYKQDMWWAISSSCFSAGYDYLCFRVKGEEGGEEQHLSLKFGDGDYADIGVSGQDKITDFTPAEGSEIKITKDWSTIAIDMNASKIVQKIDGKEVPMPKTFNGIHFNSSAAGKIYIDCIWFTTDPKFKMPEGSYLKSLDGDKKDEPKEETPAETEAAPAETEAAKPAEDAPAATEAAKPAAPAINLSTDQMIFWGLICVAVIIAIICIVLSVKGNPKATEKISDVVDNAKEKAEDIKEKAEEKVEDVKEAVEEKVDDIKEKIDEKKEDK